MNSTHHPSNDDITRNIPIHIAVIFLLFALSPIGVYASELPPQASIYLQSNNGDELKIGTVDFAPSDEQKTSIDVRIDNNDFTDHFLSMRPFRCLEGDIEWFCHLQYPYELRNEIVESDLTDLEYQLLFLLKKTSQHGIDAWDGLYYKLTLQANGVITGKLYEGDLNVLQSPPANPYDKPIELSEFIEASKTRRFPFLTIR